MPEVTYYFNAYTTPVWSDPADIVDGDIGTFGSTSSKKTAQTLTGNTCPGTDLGAVLRVELRIFASGDGDDRIDITPVFTGGNGDVHQTTPVVSPGAWTPYVDITGDTNAPDWSLWSQIQDLDCIINSVPVAKGNTLYCAKVEIRVTHIPTPDIDVGSLPCNRPSGVNIGGWTVIDSNNPANASGILHTIMLHTSSVAVVGLRVGTFYTTNGNTLKCRDSVALGDVEASIFKVFSGLSLEVQAGDYIGVNAPTIGTLRENTSGYPGYWWVAGEYIDPNDETTYTFASGYTISLYGYGTIREPVVSTQAVTEIAGTTATGNGNITDIGIENASKRGVCWNTTGNPTVGDSKSEETDSFGTGAFTRPMTGLTPEQHYYVKAYAYNSEGYGYGSQVEFDTLPGNLDVGAAPIDRGFTLYGFHTCVAKNNPANASGTLHTVQVWALTSITTLRVGTFYTTNGNTLKCRDSVLIGNVISGAVRTFTELSIAVEAGDYIGCYFTGGSLELDTAGFDGLWWIEGEYIDPNDEVEYSLEAGDAMSLCGYGDIEAPPEGQPYIKRVQCIAGMRTMGVNQIG